MRVRIKSVYSMLSELHKQLLNNFQQNFPLTERPYLTIAEQLGVSEASVLQAFNELSEQHYISRVGPVIKPNHIGCSTLVAMAIPAQQLAAVAAVVSSYPEVNHNYERENDFNLWFVVIAEHAQHLQSVIAEIEQQTGFSCMQLPLIADYFINLGFALEW